MDLWAHNGYCIGSDRKSFSKGISISAGWPPSWLPYHTFSHFSHAYFFFSSFLSFSFSLTLHSSHFVSPFSLFLYGMSLISPHPRLSIWSPLSRHQHLQVLFEASASESPLMRQQYLKSSSRHMWCKSSSRHQFLIWLRNYSWYLILPGISFIRLATPVGSHSLACHWLAARHSLLAASSAWMVSLRDKTSL